MIRTHEFQAIKFVGSFSWVNILNLRNEDTRLGVLGVQSLLFIFHN